MFIKNQTFSDEETLLEVLFDFELGTPSMWVKDLQAVIAKDLQNHADYQALLASKTDEEDRMEMDDEERRQRLSDALRERFASFKVLRQKLYGVRDGEEQLLWEIDLV